MAVLDEANKLKQQRIKEVDEWIDNHIIQEYEKILDDVERQGKDLASTVKELDGTLTSSRIRRLFNMRSLRREAESRTQGSMRQAMSGLRSIGPNLRRNGIDDAALLAALQFINISEERREELQEVTKRGVSVSLPAGKDILASGSNLEQRFLSFGPVIGEQLENEIVDSIVLNQGRSPEQKIEGVIGDTIGTALAWSISMANMALWSLFAGGMHSYISSNQSWLQGWMWSAVLDFKTCPSCIALHGTIFPFSVEMNDHPHGRCIPIPIVERSPELLGGDSFGIREVTVTSGEDWFNDLDEDTQKSILGESSWSAWNSGAVNFSDFTADVSHDIYGSIRRRASLTEILGEEEAQQFKT